MAANGVMQGAQLFIRLAEVPILLMFWGATGYGEWLLVAALPAALSLSDGGFTKAAQREMTMRAGRNDENGVRAAFQSAWLMLLLLTIVVMLFVGAIVPNVPLLSWLKITTTDSQGLTIALVALAAQVLVYFQCGLLYGAFASTGKYATGVLLIAASSLMCFSGLIGGAASGGGIPAAACGSLLGQIAGYCVMLVASIWQGVSPGYGIRNATRREIKLMWAPSMANLAFPVADAMNNQGMRLVVGLTLGPVALAAFSTTRTLCRLTLQPVLSIARTLEPELSLAYGAGHAAEARNLFVRSSHMGFWLSISLSMVVATVGPFFYRIWAGGHVHLNSAALLVMLVASILGALWGIALAVPCSVNKHAPVSLPFIGVYGLAPVLVVLFLTKLEAGIAGAALGVLLGDALALGLVVSLALKVSGIGFGNWLSETVRSPVDVMKQMMGRLKMLLTKSRRRVG